MAKNIVRRRCNPGSHTVTSKKGKKFCRLTSTKEEGRKTRKDKGKYRHQWADIGIYKGKALHKSPNGAVFYINNNGNKTYLSAKKRATMGA